MIKIDPRKTNAYEIPGVDVADFTAHDSAISHSKRRWLWKLVGAIIIVIILIVVIWYFSH